MQFSDVYSHDGLCVSSPDGRYIAHNEHSRIVIRHTTTLKQHTTFTTESPIIALHWSPDSTLILATLTRSHTLQLFSLTTHSPLTCRIDDPTPITAATLAPDSRHILTTCELLGRATLYSLLTQHTHTITAIKHHHLVSFSPDGSTLASVERHGHCDHLALYSLATHQPLHHTPLPTTDTADIVWSTDSTHLLCLDSPLYGAVCSVHAADGCVEWVRGLIEADGAGVGGGVCMGVRCAAWSSCGRWLALGGWDERVELWHVRTWTRVLQWQASDTLSRTTIVYEETTTTQQPPHEPTDTNNQENDDNTLHLDQLTIVDNPPPLNSRHRRHGSNSSVASSAASTVPGSRHKTSHSAVSDSRPSTSSSSSRPLTASNRPAVTVTSAVRSKPHTSIHTSHYVIAPRNPYTLPTTGAPSTGTPVLKSHDSTPLPPPGITLLSFSPDKTYCCFTVASYPRCLFVLSIAALSLHSLLVQLQPVSEARWQRQSVKGRLLLCGGGRLYGWSEDGCSVTSVPHDGFGVRRFEVCGAVRDESKAAVLLLDDAKLCCMYEQ